MTKAQEIVTLIGLHTGLTALLTLLAMSFAKTHNKRLLILFFSFFILTTAVLFIPRIAFFTAFKMNWQGKLLSCLLPIAFVYFLPHLDKKQLGFTWRINRKVWTPFFILTAIGILFNIFVRGIPEEKTSIEYLIFELTMPGLSEEPIFRGVLLGLLNLVFVSRVTLLGIKVGWGFLLQSFLFGIGHAFYYDELGLQFHFPVFLVTFVIGLVLTYVKERGQSLIPAILFHNIYNSTLPLLSLFV